MDIHFTIGADTFVWNDVKAQKNIHKHGILFEEAIRVFSDPLFILVEASRNDEARDAAIGFDALGRLLYVVHIEIEDTAIRIISARRADAKEESKYAI